MPGMEAKRGVRERVQLLPGLTPPPPAPTSSPSPPATAPLPPPALHPPSHRPSPATRCLCLPPSLMDPSHSSPGEGIRAPSFSSYLYFLFCPTLIYRETYPR